VDNQESTNDPDYTFRGPYAHTMTGWRGYRWVGSSSGSGSGDGQDITSSPSWQGRKEVAFSLWCHYHHDTPLFMFYFFGSCQKAYCPKGDFYRTPGMNEVQRINCTATNGSFVLTFRRANSDPIAWNASATLFEQRIEAMTR